jgi:putative ABC transport system permease protein
MLRILMAPLAFMILLLQSAFLALGQIWTNKTRSALTTIGIIIGVASVTAVIAALTGLKSKILSEFESIGTNTIFIGPHRPEEGVHRKISWEKISFKPQEFDDLLEHCPSIERFTRICGFSDSLRYGDKIVENVPVTGINLAWHKIQSRSVTLGRPFSMIDETRALQVCLITPEVQDKLRLDRDCTGQTIFIGRRPFRIVGMVEEWTSMFDMGRSKVEVFIPFDTAWKIEKWWMNVLASSKSPELSEEARAELKFFMRSSRKLKPGEPDTFRIMAVEQALAQFEKVSVIITAVAGGIVGISLLVGGVGIMNIMLVSVSERTREIGLRKAVGARPSAIMLQFLVEAVMLCLMGGLIGVGFGQLLTSAIANIPKANLDMAYIPLWAISLAFGFSALVGIFFGFFPAIKAARLDPIEALRHE